MKKWKKMTWIPEKLFQLSLTTMEYNGQSEKSCSRRAEQVIVSVLPAILSKGRNWCSWQIAVLVFGSLLHFFLPWHVVSSSTVYRGETGHHQHLLQPPPTSSPWLLLHLSASVGRRSPDLTRCRSSSSLSSSALEISMARHRAETTRCHQVAS